LSLVHSTRISFQFYLKSTVETTCRKLNLNMLVKDEAYHADVDPVMRSVGAWIHVHAKLIQERQESVIKIEFTEPVDPASQYLECVATLVKSQERRIRLSGCVFG